MIIRIIRYIKIFGASRRTVIAACRRFLYSRDIVQNQPDAILCVISLYMEPYLSVSSNITLRLCVSVENTKYSGMITSRFRTRARRCAIF